MQTYPGQGNPVLRALTGEISTRQLRVMVEHLPPENAAIYDLYDLVTMREIMHDVSDQLRLLRAEFSNVHRDKDQPPITHPDLLPRPAQHDGAEPEKQAQVKAEQEHFLAVLNRPDPH